MRWNDLIISAFLLVTGVLLTGHASLFHEVVFAREFILKAPLHTDIGLTQVVIYFV